MTARTEKINRVLSRYTARPISEIRAEFATLVDEVSHRSRRIILTKHGKAVAAIVPIEDLVDIDAAEANDLKYMAERSHHNKAAEHEPLADDQLRLLQSFAEAFPGKSKFEKMSMLKAAISTLMPLVNDIASSMRNQMEESVLSVQMPEESRRRILERMEEARLGNLTSPNVHAQVRERTAI